MAKVRSPNYPILPLGPALEAVRPAFKNENRNKMSRAVLAKHLGYNSLNGRSLGKIGAVRAYGLLDGSGDELRVSDDAVTALNAPKDSPERSAALGRLALKPALFQELQKAFPNTLPSLENLKFSLVKKQFTPDAAEKAAKSFLATMNLVSGIPDAYNPPDEDEETPENGGNGGAKPGFSPLKPPILTGVKVQIMAGERELTTGLLSKEAKFRLIVSGPVGVREIERLIAKLELDKEILAEIDYVEGSWHFLEFTSDVAEQEVARFASALQSKFTASGSPDGCEAYRKDENGAQLVFLNPGASQLAAQMPLWASGLHSINVGPNPDLSAFKRMGVFV